MKTLSDSDTVRLSVRVRPGASRTVVGGRYGDAAADSPDVLCVAVTAPAVDGAATGAVVQAVATAFSLPRRAVSLVTGKTSRTKVLELHGNPRELQQRLRELLGD